VEYDYDVYGRRYCLIACRDHKRAKEERYEIRVAEENKRIAEKDVQLARGAYYPTVNAFLIIIPGMQIMIHSTGILSLSYMKMTELPMDCNSIFLYLMDLR
jgi:hypothetical protein